MIEFDWRFTAAIFFGLALGLMAGYYLNLDAEKVEINRQVYAEYQKQYEEKCMVNPLGAFNATQVRTY